MDELFGRNDECTELRAVLDRARQGMAAAVLLRGEPGSGKTALLDYVHRTADPEFEVMRFDAVESEAELSYAGLHQLLLPHLGRIAKIPEPQRKVLGRVFGMERASAPPDRFLVALATLALVGTRSDPRPLLVLVDDAHWIDRESAEVLMFAARRLYADSAAMVFAAREPGGRTDPLADLPTLAVDRLTADAAARLLESAVGTAVHPDVSARIVAGTGGNPLALIEVARELRPEQLTGEVPLPDPIPVGHALERGYLREAMTLPPRTRTLLLTAAADPTNSPTLLWRAGSELDFDASDAAAAEERNLLIVRDNVKFRHPLIRSALYYGATLAARVQVHAALATATGDLGNADQRAWHLAAAATGPDEAVAAELELAAARTRDRGGWTSASSLLARAAVLTPASPDRTRRLLQAAEASVVAGSPGLAQAQLDEANALINDQRQRGMALRVQARVHRLAGAPGEATAALLAAARELGPTDIRTARDILVEALVQAQISESLAPQGATRLSVAEAVRSLPLPPGEPVRAGDLMLEADTALHLEGLDRATPLLKAAITAAAGEQATAPEFFQLLAAACFHATMLGDDVTFHELVQRMESEARHQSSVIPLTLALSYNALSELIAGHLAQSERYFDQRAALEEARGSELHLGTMLIAAWRGQAEPTAELLDAVAEHATRTGQGYQLVYRDYARCILALGQGRYRDALLSLEPRMGDGCQLKFAIVDLVEAAIRCGENRKAATLREDLAHLARRTPVPGLLGDLARAQAVTCEVAQEAEQLYLTAIDHHENTRGPGHRARSHQLYGEWLRREKRTKEARRQLRIALDLFDAMGAHGFAARTAQELSAAGDPHQPRDFQHRDDELTAQEARVAHLAASGATNAEIAAQLFLSAHTVDYHLRKVFRRLDVHSRRSLRQRYGR
ncbi:DNA-binding CsgD family transcriptional regulator [Streptacidiphilus sp. MAP12-16]|uniref:AAA family ATPase n=1 Tax=Streptacidiphilus sp. MAP12-16 TaxID=3156300 RepID=UPI0035175318